MSIKLFLQLVESSMSCFIDTDQFKDKYASLAFGNGGSWCRLDGTFGKKNKIITIKANGICVISQFWKPTESEQIQIDSKIVEIKRKEMTGNKIVTIGYFGQVDNAQIGSRSISENIKKFFKDHVCVHCGTSTNIEIDHKNGLMNDPRVMNTKTQKVDDFQPLCKHCNDVKRQTIKKMKETGIRHKASSIPILSGYGVDYIKGGETFDVTDSCTMIGTYWYDPILFMKTLNDILP